MNDPELRQALSLIGRGISEDTAFKLKPYQRAAFLIIFGEVIDGNEWDFRRMKWVEKK